MDKITSKSSVQGLPQRAIIFVAESESMLRTSTVIAGRPCVTWRVPPTTSAVSGEAPQPNLAKGREGGRGASGEKFMSNNRFGSAAASNECMQSLQITSIGRTNLPRAREIRALAFENTTWPNGHESPVKAENPVALLRGRIDAESRTGGKPKIKCYRKQRYPKRSTIRTHSFGDCLVAWPRVWPD